MSPLRSGFCSWLAPREVLLEQAYAAAVCPSDERAVSRDFGVLNGHQTRLETLIAQRIHGLALGYEDLNDHDELRHDPVLGLVSGKAKAGRGDCAVLAGKSTLKRLEHAPKTQDDRYRKTSVDEGAVKRLFEGIGAAKTCAEPEGKAQSDHGR